MTEDIPPIFDAREFVHGIENYMDTVINESSIPKGHQPSLTETLDRLELINQTANAIAAQIRFLEFVSRDNGKIEFGEIAVYQAVQRAIYAAKGLSKKRKRGLNFIITGNSFRRLHGPKFFLFVPWCILNNAVKYSPPKMDIEVKFIESNGRIEIEILSTGPLIETDERERIFEKNFRGCMAVKSDRFGEGVGLYHARHAMKEFFSGTVSYRDVNSPTMLFNSIPYKKVSFVISINL